MKRGRSIAEEVVATLTVIWVFLITIVLVIQLHELITQDIESELVNVSQDEVDEMESTINSVRILLGVMIVVCMFEFVAATLVFQRVRFSVWGLAVGLGLLIIGFQVYSSLVGDTTRIPGLMTGNMIQLLFIGPSGLCFGVCLLGAIFARVRPPQLVPEQPKDPLPSALESDGHSEEPAVRIFED